MHEQESQTKKARLRDSVTQRQIRDLSVNIQMKEELIKELDKTGTPTWFFIYRMIYFAVCLCTPDQDSFSLSSNQEFDQTLDQ